MILSKNRHKKISKQFQRSSINPAIITKYEKYLYYKVVYKTISIQYAKRLLNTTINFLIYCKNFKSDKPSLLALEGYLWIYPTHKYYLSNFTSFLSKNYSFKINITQVEKAELRRPKRSHQILKKRLIKILQNPSSPYLTEDYIFRTAIGYLHWIDIPQNVFLNKTLIKKSSDNNLFISACTNKFYVPKRLLYIIYS